MATLSEGRIATLLAPYVRDADISGDLHVKLGVYLDLLLKWNARMNLTSIRNPEEIVRRHFGESLFLGRHLPAARTLLDFGSGGGFPGLPIQLLLPEVRVTLAECQGKKAAFLRESIRILGLNTIVWAGRVEAMPAESAFDIVTMRAVDQMEAMLSVAKDRLVPGGTIAILTTGCHGIPVPQSENGVINLLQC